MKLHKFLLFIVGVGILFFPYTTYAFKQSVFRFTFHNSTDSNIVSLKKTAPSIKGTLIDYKGPVDIQPSNMHQYFFVQAPQTDSDKNQMFATLLMETDWLLTVKDKTGKVACQNKMRIWIKALIISDGLNGAGVNTNHWRYKILSLPESLDYPMCPFNNEHPKKLPGSYKVHGKKYYPFSFYIGKDNKITVQTY